MSERCPRALSYRHKILYVGSDLELWRALTEALRGAECYVDRCPAGWLARVFIKSDIVYALLVLGDVAGESGAELAGFVKSLPHRAGTPVIVLSEGDGAQLIETCRRMFAGS